MEYLIVLLLIFIGILFLMQVVFFEMTRSKMEKANNMNWFLSLDKPFSYNRVGYMVFLCLICYLISSPVELFTLNWFVYFVLFLAMGIVADAVVQYAIMVYSKKRCRRQIEDAHLLQNELQHFSPGAEFENDYTVTLPSYNESEILRRYINPEDHLAVMSVDAGKFASQFKDDTEAMFIIEPYTDTQRVQGQFVDGSSVKVTTLTPTGKMPFKDEKIDTVMCQECNYDKSEILRVLKKGGYFVVNQHGTDNLKEFVRLYMPFQMKGKWDAESCVQTLESIGMRVVDKFEDYGTIRFHSIQAIYQYFTKVSSDFANINRYQMFYLQALKEIKDHSYFEMTTHRFLVVAQKMF
ncbi:class I SAM-dependent methyltransferase [Allocoprobacillus halotolerans]|uniref:Class I SAM-dependent methyltransferase n=1 Tax=Allocoprobacillus halotolerans TaxID=2944914 RepID=A0ABY5I576_9FIRM|nr:hypothetical protein [Allocoprobacillus halotolerans]UTY40120.1 class I SAM-dependent methyltransferase [Allocoprobacillus halotolerans]